MNHAELETRWSQLSREVSERLGWHAERPLQTGIESHGNWNLASSSAGNIRHPAALLAQYFEQTIARVALRML